MTDGSRKGIGGPKTPEGKRKVSLNALKHGLWAESPQGLKTLADDIGLDYDKVLCDMRTYYFPRDPVEDILVKRIARCAWRLMLTEAIEMRNISCRGITTSLRRTHESIIRHERLIDIQLHRAMAALAEKRASDQKTTGNKLEVEFPWNGEHDEMLRRIVPSKVAEMLDEKHRNKLDSTG